jgi:hypothetical protein
VRKLEARGGVSDPRALAAAIGRRKFGSRRFQQLAAAGRRRASLRRNSRPAPKFKAGDMVQGMSGRMKLFGPQRVASALYDGDMEEWTYYLPETRHAWVEGMLRSAKAPLAPNGKKREIPLKELRQRMGWAFEHMEMLGKSDVPTQALREAQRAIVYAELLGDAKARAKASKAANFFDSCIREAAR